MFLIPPKKIVCGRCLRFFRTWNGRDWHDFWVHVFAPNENVIVCVGGIIACLAALVYLFLYF